MTDTNESQSYMPDGSLRQTPLPPEIMRQYHGSPPPHKHYEAQLFTASGAAYERRDFFHQVIRHHSPMAQHRNTIIETQRRISDAMLKVEIPDARVNRIVKSGPVIRTILHAQQTAGMPYYWRPEQSQLVVEASVSLPTATTWHRRDLPSPCMGWWGEYPLYHHGVVLDEGKRPLLLSYAGLLITLMHVEEPAHVAQYMKVKGSVCLAPDICPEPYHSLNIVTMAYLFERGMYTTPYAVPMEVGWWDEGETAFDAVTEMVVNSAWGEAEDVEKASVVTFTAMTQFILAGLFFIRDKLFVAKRERLDRADRRRLLKAGITSDDDIHVIAMREREAVAKPRREGEAEPVDWQYQWLVRGHWHTYRTGPERSETTQRWVAPYVKGPDDKPLIHVEKLFDVRR